MTCKEAESLVMPYIKNELMKNSLNFWSILNIARNAGKSWRYILLLTWESGSWTPRRAIITSRERLRQRSNSPGKDWKPFGSLRSCAMRYPHSALWH